ncbi:MULTISPECIES: 1-phosphofructokinase [unclassified Moraxella]|uniref:1-phosphofructokinase n=1 Tax=unclassified Moraxella TaxID=2685852 RepID=UPI003AF6D295
MAKFLCITLNPAIDITLQLPTLAVGQVNRASHSHSRPAGKGLNVAQVLKSLGHDVWVTGFLGEANQAIFLADFTTQGLHNAFVTVMGETRQNIKIAEDNGQMTDVNGKGFSVTDADKAKLLTILPKLCQQVDYVVMAGSLPQAFSLADFAELITTIQQHNPKLAIDSSGDALTTAVSHSPFLLKPNTDELQESFGLPAESLEQQRTLLAHLSHTLHNHTPNWVISMGEQGVNWLNPTQSLHANPPKVTVKSTVGAGDTLLAGVLHGIATALSTTETLRQATALASHTVSQIGCQLPDTSRLNTLMAQVSIEPLV